MAAEQPAEPAVPSDPFVHLHTHTEYSLLDGAARIDDLVGEARRLGQPGVAITDHGVLYGAVEFVAAATAAGVNPILGCEAYMAPRSRHDKEGRADRDPNHLVLLARDNTGYRNLVSLVSKSHLEGYYYKPRIDKELLAEHAEGLMCLSACIGGELPQAILRGDMDAAESVARQHMEIFGPDNYFLEVQDHGIPEEEAIREGLLEIARRTGLPMVCTNDSHYIRSEDAEAHDILLCLQTGARRQDEKRFKFAGPHFYVASGEEMRTRFAAYGEAASNTLYVAQRCKVEMQLGQTLLPRYEPIPAGMDAVSYLRHLCEEGLRERYGPSPSQEAWDRLGMELDVIEQTGFSAYFLIVWDFMRAARCDHGVKVGPGRGSAAGSLVSYVLHITNLDPLRYNLLFERFLNKERVSMPDIDCDFDDRRRDRVIAYVQQKYGSERVAQIITFGTMAARAAIRDVGRVLDVPLAEVDRLAKLVPQQVGITLESALAQSRELREVYEGEPWARQVIDNAVRLEGICRNASTHAAGVVIAPEPLANIVPLQRSTTDRESIVTQFDMNGVQKIGLLKMDFLGLSNLTIIDEALQFVRQTRGEDIDINELPLDDEATYALFGRADTLGVFQFEGAGAKKVLIDMQPQNLEDLSAANALNRPGPIEGGVIDIYMKRKRGEEPIEYLTGLADKLHPILAETHGTIVYQEQVMMIARAVAGFTLAEADILRAAMGKKDKAKMAKQREKFLRGAAENGTDEKIAAELFDLIAFFAGYGFNRCIRGKTEVMDALTGERTTVDDLYRRRRPFTIHGLGEDGHLRPRAVTDVMSNGRKAVYRLRTALGHAIHATATHRFLTFTGWHTLEDLRPGDRIAAPRALAVDTSETWPEHELVTLGLLLSEGNTCHPTCLYFYNNDPELIDDFTRHITCFPDTVARLDVRRNGRMEVCVNTGRDARFKPGHQPWNAVIGSAALEVQPVQPRRSGAFEWARSLGILGVRATEKRVPEPVFRLRDEDVELFLGRLWAGDGYIASATTGQCTPFYATSSAQLARDVQMLLLRLGITSSLHTKYFKYRDTERAGYTVHVIGDGAVERFVERVASHCVGRQDDVATLIQYLETTERGSSSRDTIPAEVRDVVDEGRRRLGWTWDELADRSGISMTHFRSRSGTKQGFRRSALRDVARALGSEKLLQIASSDVVWDRVVSIELSGVEETYDLTVDVDHNFVADGLVVHNSHSMCYSLVSYQTAYLKANYPLEYMAALLNSRGGDFDKLKQTILDARARRLDVRPPDVNRSVGGFSVGDVEKGEILYGLHHIKNVGEKVIDAVLEAREAGGPFTSLLDLCERVSSKDMNRRVLEALIRSGACDCLGERAALLAVLDQVLDRVAQVRRERDSGQTSLFGGATLEDAPPLTVDLHMPNVQPTPDHERLDWEKEFLGMYLSDHPLRRVEEELRAKTDTALGELGTHLDGCTVQVGGALRSVRAFVPKRSTTGQRMAFLQLEDMSGTCEVVVFARTFEECVDLLQADRVVVVRGRVEARGRGDAVGGSIEDERGEAEQPKILAEAVYALDDIRLSTWRGNRTVHISLAAQQLGMLDALRAAFTRSGGDTAVVLHIEDHEKVVDVSLAEEYCVDPGPALERDVEALLGAHAYRLEVRREKAPEREGRRTAARRS